jgi:hypothetical protein
MFTSYSLEMIASSTHREALAAAEARRLARAVRSTRKDTEPASPARDTIRIPRSLRWFGVAVAGR